MSGMLDQWDSLSDLTVLSALDMIRVHISFQCTAIATISGDDLRNALQASGPIQTVLETSDSFFDSLNPLSLGYPSYTWTITVNPVDGVTAGEIRNAAYTAMSSLNGKKLIPCRELTVGIIEKNKGSVLAAPGVSVIAGATGFVALAVIAVVVLLLVHNAENI